MAGCRADLYLLLFPDSKTFLTNLLRYLRHFAGAEHVVVIETNIALALRRLASGGEGVISNRLVNSTVVSVLCCRQSVGHIDNA